MKLRATAALLVLSLLAASTQAHSLGQGYLFLNVNADGLSGRVEMHLEDIDQVLKLDANGDGKVSEEEFNSKRDEVTRYFKEHLWLGVDGNRYAVDFQELSILRIDIGEFGQLPFTTQSANSVPDSIEVGFDPFIEEIPHHKNFLIIEKNVKTNQEHNRAEIISLVFTGPERKSLDLTEPPQIPNFSYFLREGVWHIWIGLDHILFLVALLLPSVLVWEDNQFEPAPSFGAALWRVVKIATAFTLAHSITLGLAALNIIQLPGWIVESIIAASIVVASIDNIFPVLQGKIIRFVFAFGLFHGLGFASVMSHLELSQVSIVTTLLGFNIGVEIGQVAIIAVVIPFLYLMRRCKLYQPVVLRGGSVILIVLGTCWMIERLFDLTILGF